MRFTSLIAVSSLVITLGAFQVAAVQEDASLATFENNAPMINIARRAEPEAEQAGGAAEGAEQADAMQDVAEAAVSQKDQVALADVDGKENNKNEGRSSDGNEKGVQEAAANGAVESAEGAKSKKAGKMKKHAKAAGKGGASKASKKGAAKASKGSKATKASKGQGRVRQASMGGAMDDGDQPRRSASGRKNNRVRQAGARTNGGRRRAGRAGRKSGGGLGGGLLKGLPIGGLL